MMTQKSISRSCGKNSSSPQKSTCTGAVLAAATRYIIYLSEKNGRSKKMKNWTCDLILMFID